MPALNVITGSGHGRLALALLGAGTLALGGAGFLTSSGASTDPTCAQPSSGTAAAAPAASDTGTGSPGAVPAADPSIGSLAAGALSNLPDGTTLPGVRMPGAPTASPGATQNALDRFLAQLNALLSVAPGSPGGLPLGGLPGAGLPLGGTAAGGTGGSPLFVGATGSSGQAGVIVTPDPTPRGSQVGVVGVPGISGPVANFGL